MTEYFYVATLQWPTSGGAAVQTVTGIVDAEEDITRSELYLVVMAEVMRRMDAPSNANIVFLSIERNQL